MYMYTSIYHIYIYLYYIPLVTLCKLGQVVWFFLNAPQAPWTAEDHHFVVADAAAVLYHPFEWDGNTLWLLNIAMEHCPFIDGLPIKHGDLPWLC